MVTNKKKFKKQGNFFSNKANNRIIESQIVKL